MKLKSSKPLWFDEQIIVVPTHCIMMYGEWHGINKNNIEEYVQLIINNKKSMMRGPAEIDFNFKQIIPYVVFTHNNKFFLMQRKSGASEQRLANKLSLGIGGHLRIEDMVNDTIFDWALREFHEEVSYDGIINFKIIGLINDDTTDVGRVHLGIVLLAYGSHNKIEIKSEMKYGYLATLEECRNNYTHLESWSQFIVDELESCNN